MPNLVVQLKRWSVEEIEAVTGRELNKENLENKKKERKQKKSSRKIDHEKNEISNKENVESGINCRKKIKGRNMTMKKSENLDPTEKRNVGISKHKSEENHIVIDERVDIRKKSMKKNKSKVNIRSVENNSLPTNDDNLTHTSKKNCQKNRKNEKSKCSKRRVEITGNENIIYPDPKKRKMSIDQKVNACISERVTRSKTKILKSNISNINENETSKAKAAEKVSEPDQNLKNKKDLASNDDPKLNIAKEPKNIDEKLKIIAVQIKYKVGEVVWAKIRGFPGWPARIEDIFGGKRQMFRIFWFNDYRYSNVYINQIFKFHSYFEQFSKPFNSHIGLETAAREALMYIAAETQK